MLSKDVLTVGDDDGATVAVEVIVYLAVGREGPDLIVVEVEQGVAMSRQRAVAVDEAVFLEVGRVVGDVEAAQHHACGRGVV